MLKNIIFVISIVLHSSVFAATPAITSNSQKLDSKYVNFKSNLNSAANINEFLAYVLDYEKTTGGNSRIYFYISEAYYMKSMVAPTFEVALESEQNFIKYVDLMHKRILQDARKLSDSRYMIVAACYYFDVYKKHGKGNELQLLIFEILDKDRSKYLSESEIITLYAYLYLIHKNTKPELADTFYKYAESLNDVALYLILKDMSGSGYKCAKSL